MSFRHARGVLRPSQGYVCISCSLQSIRSRNWQSLRYQHAEASQDWNSIDVQSIPGGNAKTEDRTKAKTKHEASHHDTGSSLANNPSPAKAEETGKTQSNANALKLEEYLQRQFTARRRQTIAAQAFLTKAGPLTVSSKLRAKPAAVADKGEAKEPGSVRLARKQGIRDRKRLRALAKKSSSSTQPKSTTGQQASSGDAEEEALPGKDDDIEGKSSARNARRKPSMNQIRSGDKGGADISRLSSDIRTLKEALESDDNAKQAFEATPDLSNLPIGAEESLRVKSKNKKPVIEDPRISRKLEEETASSADLPRIRKHASGVKEEETPGSADLPKIRKHASNVKDHAVTLGGDQPPPKATSKVRRIQAKQADTQRPNPARKTPNVAGSSEASSKTKAQKNVAIQAVSAADLEISALDVPQPPIRNLSYGLDRVLFNPGVYHLQDPRSRVYNFDSYLQKIMPVAEFDFNALKAYVTSSRDEALSNIAQTHNKRYTGSSSSMTGVLAHYHFLLSQWRMIHTNMLSHEFPVQQSLKSFTVIQRAPSAVFLRWKNGSYAIDADKQFASANVLMMLGKSMEKLLTLSKDEFERYRKSSPDQVPLEERNAPESYHYSTMGDFLMRSQLDAYDSRLPGTGMFDLKTRAVVAVRMDAKQYEQGMDYEIKTRHGAWESYEREYFDMIRAAFLKYSLQVRMGRMDGIFVAFHNTQRIFGFQYISSAEMDAALHGQWDTTLGDQEFKLSLDLLNKVLDKATKKYPETSLRIHFEAREAQTPFMYIFAEPVTEEQIHELQSQNDAEVEKFERNILGFDKVDAEADAQHSDDSKWAAMQADVEEEMDNDEASLIAPNTEASLPEDGEALDGRTLWTDAGLYTADEYTTTPITMDDHIPGQQDQDADKLKDVTEKDDTTLLNEDGHSEGIGNSAGRSEGIPREFQDEPELANQELDREEVPEDDPSNMMVEEEENQDEASNAEAVDESRPAATKAQEMEEVDESNDPETTTSTSTGLVISESPTGELKIESHPSFVQADPSVADDEDFDTQADAPFLNTIISESPPPPNAAQEVLAMTLTIRNKVNDRYVIRPENLTSSDEWRVEYALSEVEKPEKAWTLYQASQTRRKKQLDKADDDDEKTVEWYIRNLRELSKKGKEWRRQQDEMDRARPKVVLGQELPEGDSKP